MGRFSPLAWPIPYPFPNPMLIHTSCFLLSGKMDYGYTTINYGLWLMYQGCPLNVPLLRSAMGKTHVFGEGLWWVSFETECRSYSEIGQIHLSIEAQCGTIVYLLVTATAIICPILSISSRLPRSEPLMVFPYGNHLWVFPICLWWHIYTGYSSKDVSLSYLMTGHWLTGHNSRMSLVHLFNNYGWQGTNSTINAKITQQIHILDTWCLF